MRSTPFTSCSMGVATVSATVLALAPGYVAVTCTVGGATSGYWAIGSCVSATPPTIRNKIDRTVAKIGRSMKKCEITAGYLDGSLAEIGLRGLGPRRRLCRSGLHRVDRVVDPRHLKTLNDDPIVGLESSALSPWKDHAHPVVLKPAGIHIPSLDHVLVIHHQDVLPIL